MADGGGWDKAGFPFLAANHLISSTIMSNPTWTGDQIGAEPHALKVLRSSYRWSIITEWQGFGSALTVMWHQNVFMLQHDVLWSCILVFNGSHYTNNDRVNCDTLFFNSGKNFFYKIVLFHIQSLELTPFIWMGVLLSGAVQSPCMYSLKKQLHLIKEL